MLLKRGLQFVALAFITCRSDLGAQSQSLNLNGSVEVLLRDRNVSRSGGRVFISPNREGKGLDFFLVQNRESRIYTLAQGVDAQKLLLAAAKQPRLMTVDGVSRSTASRSAVGDLNNDGSLDAVLPQRDGKGLSVFSYTASGEWKAEFSYSIPGELSRIALDRLRVSSTSAGLSIFVGHSAGIDVLQPRRGGGMNFERATLLNDVRGISALAIGDLDSDGNNDLLAVAGEKGTILALKGNGNGVFSRSPEFEDNANTGSVNEILLVDWNADGKPDLVYSSGNQLMFALNTGSGFGEPQKIELPAEALQISVLSAGLEGTPTCVVETKNKLTIVFRGQQKDSWVLDRVLMAGYSDSEGFDLLLLPGHTPALIRSGRNSNSILLDRLDSARGISIPGRVDQLSLVDLNLDGNPDLIAAGSGPDGGLWIKNGNSPNFERVGSLRPTRVCIAFLDSDRWIDLVVLDESGEKAIVYVVPGIGEGVMGVPTEVWRDENRESKHWIIAVGDYSNDRIPDLGMVAESGLFISQLGLGNRLFQAPVRHHLAVSPADAVVAEVYHYQLNFSRSSFLILDGGGNVMPAGKKRSVIAYTANRLGLDLPLLVMELPENCRARQLRAGRLDRFPIASVAFLCAGPEEEASVYWRNSYEFRRMWSGKFESFNIDFLERNSHGDVMYLGRDLFVQRGRLELGSISNPVRMPGGDAVASFSTIQVKGTPVAQLLSGRQSYIFLHFNLLAEQGNARTVSSTSLENAPIVPGAFFSALGPYGLVSAKSSAESQWPLELSGFRAELETASGDVYRARIGFVSEAQVNMLAPDDLPLSVSSTDRVTLRLISEAEGIVGWNAMASVARINPGVFSAGNGLAAGNVLRLRGTQQTMLSTVQLQGSTIAPLPIDLGPITDRVFLLLYGTGIKNRAALDRVRVTIGGVEAPLIYAGAQGQYEGLDQINVEIPRILAGRGLVPVAVEVEGKSANRVFISIQ